MKDRKGFLTEPRLREWMHQNNIDVTEREFAELTELMNTSEDSRGICFQDWSRFYVQANNGGARRR